MFRLCRDLKIDDPCAWMNAVPPKVIDMWFAFYWLDNESGQSDMMSPDEALQKLMGVRNVR